MRCFSRIFLEYSSRKNGAGTTKLAPTSITPRAILFTLAAQLVELFEAQKNFKLAQTLRTMERQNSSLT
jgi:hypothetical protein